MTLVLEDISPQQLSPEERQSILSHAVDLHLLGSDENVDVGFDLLAQKTSDVKHVFRVRSGNEHVGVLYLFPFRDLPGHLEMTILIHEPYRGRHFTSDVVSALERFLTSRFSTPLALCATIRDHNPLRKELTAFLQKHGYRYEPGHEAFIKRIR
jgi:RimJ/RimL family protein N-acetyltransferase